MSEVSDKIKELMWSTTQEMPEAGWKMSLGMGNTTKKTKWLETFGMDILLKLWKGSLKTIENFLKSKI